MNIAAAQLRESPRFARTAGSRAASTFALHPRPFQFAAFPGEPCIQIFAVGVQQYVARLDDRQA